MLAITKYPRVPSMSQLTTHDRQTENSNQSSGGGGRGRGTDSSRGRGNSSPRGRSQDSTRGRGRSSHRGGRGQRCKCPQEIDTNIGLMHITHDNSKPKHLNPINLYTPSIIVDTYYALTHRGSRDVIPTSPTLLLLHSLHYIIIT